MLTGEIRSQIDQIWNAFWSGGISNPLEVIEQITYLLFLKRLDEQEIAEELKANREKKPTQKRFFPEGKDNKKRSFQDYRWNRFKNTDPRDMYAVVSEHVFPWLRTLAQLLLCPVGDARAYHNRGAARGNRGGCVEVPSSGGNS
jgi:type I restriction enzyme M protein